MNVISSREQVFTESNCTFPDLNIAYILIRTYCPFTNIINSRVTAYKLSTAENIRTDFSNAFRDMHLDQRGASREYIAFDYFETFV